VLANSWRAPSKPQRLTAELGTLTTLAAPDLAGQAAERTDLLRALTRLSQPDQEVLLLAGWDGLDSAGLATALGCSVAAARARLSRARRRLAEGLTTRAETSNPTFHLIPERS
jgi:RNA polymerase sigma-70 factor (ECF subfamily)